MTVLDTFVTTCAPGVSIVETPEALTTIHRPGNAAVLWNRRPLAGFQSWLDTLPEAQLPKARIILRPDAVRPALQEITTASELPDSPNRTRLIDDIAALADIFADIMRAPFLRLRLDVVTSNACRRFHIDAVTARLVCTYRGTGTQYGISRDGADPEPIFTTPQGCPLILRGTRWPETPGAGLLHRSPPIEGTGETRLLLVLDPILDPEDEF